MMITHSRWAALAAVLALAVCCATMVSAEQALVNGDFELAGDVDSQSYGPGWEANNGLVVAGPNWHMSVSPYSGGKALGSAAFGSRTSGQIAQAINVSPGTYTITFSGQGWLYTAPGNPWEQSMVEIRLIVDGVSTRCSRLQTNINHPGSAWLPVEIQWTGPVNQSAQVMVYAAGNGLGGGWGVAVVDGLSLDISPALPSRPNYLTNGSYESAGPVGSANMGPGWFNASGWEVVGPGWYGPDACGCSPYAGTKAAGMYTIGGTHIGSMGQYVPLAPGYRRLSLRGAVYLWDVLNYGGDESTAEITWIVDSQQVQSITLIANQNNARPGTWSPIDWTWAGNVTGSSSLIIKGDLKGKSGGSMGLMATDDWLLTDYDVTNPTGMSITDDGQYTGSNTQLHAVWTGNDPQSDIGAFEYCIGTFPLNSNVVNWTNAGLAREVTHYGLSLGVGQKYYISVRARNRQGNYGPTVCTDGITVIEPPTMSIAEAKQQPDGTIVRITDKVVSTRVGKSYWLQELSEPSGIKATGEQLYNVSPYGRMTVTGVMGTVNGERVIRLASAAPVGSFMIPKAVKVGARDLGGVAYSAVLPGVADGMGPNNLGLLVTLIGRVTVIGSGYYYVDDGFAYLDGTYTGGQLNVGVRVTGSSAGLAVGNMVKVSGASSTVAGGDGRAHRALVAMLAAVKL